MNNLSAGTQGLMQGMGFNRPDLSSWNQAVNNWRQQMQANNYSYNWYPQPVQAPATSSAPATRAAPQQSRLAMKTHRLRDR